MTHSHISTAIRVFSSGKMGSVVLPVFLGLAQLTLAWTPGTSNPKAAGGFSVDQMSRIDVLSFYHTIYQASEGYPRNMAWSGNLSTGNPGTTSTAFHEDVRRRINFYRALSGQPADIVFDSSKSVKCQAAALLMSANGSLSHTPPPTWRFFSADASEAAGKSNLAMASYGPRAIDDYMVDPGAENYFLGHRRWLLYSLAQEMATGDVPPTGTSLASNAVWVIGNFKNEAPAGFTHWPNHGYIPQPLVPARWSLSFPGAEFQSAVVTMKQAGRAVPLTVISRTDTGYGDNSLVWEPSQLPPDILADTPYEVTVTNITGTEVPSTYTYPVIAFNPGRLGMAANISGPSAPPVSGQTYSFTPVPGADLYELNVSTGTTTAWAADAESTTSLIDRTARAYTLTQTAVKRSGTKAFHLAIPGFDDGDQGFEIDRNLIPSSSSQLLFYDLFRWATETTRLSAELSNDNGSTWREIWYRNGNGSTSSASWDRTFNARSVSLAAYAGQPIRIRFMLRFTEEIFDGTDTNTGVFLDDITVSSATELVSSRTTTLPGSAISFVLNASTAGAPLLARSTYYMQMRTNVGTRWFGEGELKSVTAQEGPPEPAYEAWKASFFTAREITAGLAAATNDPEQDGLNNLQEYAFGTDPRKPGGDNIEPYFDSTKMQISFPCDASRSDLTYTVETSRSLDSNSWTFLAQSKGGAATRALAPGVTVSDPGTGTRLRTVTVTASGRDFMGSTAYLRVRVTSP